MTSGTLRTKEEDFFVDEVVPPRVEQEGEHLHIRIEKRGLSTEAAVRRMAQAFGVAPRSVGRCGRKDVRAVTRQWLSFVGVKEAQVEAQEQALQLEGIQVLEKVRLPRKLRMGRFLGNRFRIRVRDLAPESLGQARERLDAIVRRGLPNNFGPQRLGPGAVNARIGRYLIQDRLGEALVLQVENSGGHEAERMGRYLAAGQEEKALAVLGRRRAGFLISAWQAQVFNRVLEARADSFDQALPGDQLQQHSSGRLLTLEDPQEAAQRVATFECSATGPLPGPKMALVSGPALELEGPVLAQESGPDSLRRQWFGCMGARRPFRVPVTEAGLAQDSDELGTYFEVTFRLPPGAFATSLIDRIFP